MKGDFTRTTFDQANHFTRVLMQQGRVQIDADWNEQMAILLHYLQTLAVDLGGAYWGPSNPNELGFEISSSENDGGNFTIGKGRYYVDGLLIENEESLPFIGQQGFSEDDLPESGKSYYAYLDVWERHVTYVQMDDIRDPGLGVGGPDTSTRAQIVWQVVLEEIQESNRANCEGAEYWVNEKRNATRPWLKARLVDEQPDENPCAIPPDSLYRGTENQLYRIEIHRPGPAWDGITDSNGAPAGNAMQAATFKWSGANGAEVWAIDEMRGNIVTVQFLGRDARTTLKVGDWVEILDDTLDLRGEPGILAQVDEVDPFQMRVTLSLPEDVDPDDPRFRWPTYQTGDSRHPLLRRWDHYASAGVAMSQGALLITEDDAPDRGWLPIEQGIEVQFQPDGLYRTADFWEAYARIGMKRLGWRWMLDEDGNEVPEALTPQGVEHHYAPLGVIVNRAVEETCRCTLHPEILRCEGRDEQRS